MVLKCYMKKLDLDMHKFVKISLDGKVLYLKKSIGRIILKFEVFNILSVAIRNLTNTKYSIYILINEF